MKTSDAGRSLIEHSEGLVLKAYRCPAGILTIGYGHTSAAGSPEVHAGLTITKGEADEILARDLDKFEAIVSRLVKVPLAQHQFDALVSFVYNVGEGTFRASTLVRRLNSGDYAGVPAQLLRWTHGGGKVLPGLVARRHAEAAMWDGMSVTAVHAGPIAQRVTPTPPPAPHSSAPLVVPEPRPTSSKGTSFIRTILLSLGAFFGVSAAHAADIAVSTFADPTLAAVGLPLSVCGSYATVIIGRAVARHFGEQAATAVQARLNEALNWAISSGTKHAAQWLDEQNFHVHVDGLVADFALKYAQAQFPGLIKKAGVDAAKAIDARLASHDDLNALKAKAAA